MEPNVLFLALAVSEMVVIVVGSLSLPAAVILQILAPLVLFYHRLGKGRTFFAFALVFGLAVVVFSGFVFSQRHAMIPLGIVFIVGLSALALAAFTRYRIGRRYGGVA